MRRRREPITTFESDADERDVPYQSLIKIWLAEKLDAD